MDILDGIAKRLIEEESKARGPQRLTDLLALSHVPRWSIVDHVRPQSVADHTFRVITIIVELMDRLKLGVSNEDYLYLVLSALYHDAAESRTGDVPTPAKASMGMAEPVGLCPWLETADPYLGMSDDLRKVLALADLIEATTFIDKYGLGDHAERVVYSLKTKIFSLCPGAWEEAVEGVMKDIETDAGR